MLSGYTCLIRNGRHSFSPSYYAKGLCDVGSITRFKSVFHEDGNGLSVRQRFGWVIVIELLFHSSSLH
ncbi:hypothetical protein D3C75_1264570 [compost metagenome]